jgi:ABC-type lipoprotein release transport system permease subunit
MGAVWARVRADLRTRWVSWLALVIALGLGGTVVLTAAAGARRTSTAFPRFLEASRAEDVLINVGPAGDPEQAQFIELLRGFPQVEAVAHFAPMLLVPPSGSLHTPYHYAAVDGSFGDEVDRPNIVDGRRPRPDRVDEVLVNRAMADEYDLEVGDRIDWRAYAVGDDSGGVLGRDSVPVSLRVVGVAVFPNEVVATAPYDSLPFIYLTPAFFERHQDRAHVYSFLAVRLRDGQAGAAGFRDQLYDTLREFGVPPQSLPVSTRFERNAQVERAIEPQAIALWVFAGLVGAGLALMMVQVLGRRILLDADEYRALQTIGMTRRQLFAGSMARVGLVAVVGAVLAVIGSTLASPLMPIGPARLAEPDPGLAFDATVLGLGFVVIVVSVVGLAAIPAWRAANVGAAEARAARHVAGAATSRLSAAVASTGAPAVPAIGVRSAVQSGQGRSRVPVWSGIVAIGIAIGLVAAAVTFTFNLDRTADTPRLYGWDWTFKVGIGDIGVDPDATIRQLERDPDVEAAALANYGSADIAGREVTAIGIDSRIGTVSPTLLEGREPIRDDEIVLGTQTLRRVGRSVGDTVRITDLFGGSGCEDCPGLRDRTMRIVGRAVFPKLGDSSHSPTNLGEGAATTANVFTFPSLPEEQYTVVLVRLRPNADVGAARARLSEFFVPQDLCASDPECVQTAQRPGDLSNFTRIRSTALILAAVLAVLALALLVHVLVSAVRRRRRDLAVFKTLGFVRRQVAGVTAWQATTMAVLASLVGLPVGLALGAITWRTFADQLGVSPDVAFPVALLVMIPGVILLANLIAAVPALLAAHTRPAAVLRSE